MTRAATNRGFAIWRIPNADYQGEPERVVTVQESSVATEFRVWLGYNDSERMHLTADAARQVRDALTEWLGESGLDEINEVVATATGCDCNPREATLNEDFAIICAECGAVLEEKP